MWRFVDAQIGRKPQSSPSHDGQKTSVTSSSQQLLERFLSNPVVMAQVEQLLSGRTRDIHLKGEIRRAFEQRSWRSAASIIRSWMVFVILLDLLLLALSFFLLSRDTALAITAPSLVIIPAALGVRQIWKKRRPDLALGSALLGGMAVILLCVCWMGVAAGGPLLNRYLHVMLSVAITGVVIFSIPFRQTVAIAAFAVSLFFATQIAFSTESFGMILFGVLFFGSGMAATVLGRRTMNKLGYKAFLLELRDRQRVSDLARSNRRLEQLSKIDGLTGVANRHLLRERLEDLRQAGGTVAILMCDIDDFKALNDHLGHLDGDRCLVDVARILTNFTRSELDCVARFGGEEFLVLLPGVTEADAMAVAERIRAAVAAAAHPNPLSRVTPVVTISIGVAVGSTTLPDNVLQKRADVALYDAKRTGRNQVRLWIPALDSRNALYNVA